MFITDLSLPTHSFVNRGIIPRTSKKTSQRDEFNPSLTHHAINMAFGVLILLIIIYSIIFRGNSHPIPALLTELTGTIPPSKGLSASFSEIVRGNFEAALKYNAYSFRIFAFFALQLLLRIIISTLIYIKSFRASTLAIADAVISAILFAYCFAPLIVYTLQQFSMLFQNL